MARCDTMPYNKSNQEQRYKFFTIPYREMIDLFIPIHEMNIISKIELPDNINVVHVDIDWRTREFIITVESPEFGILRPGMMMEQIEFDKKLIKKYQISEVLESYES
jgi:hypothetical protein